MYIRNKNQKRKFKLNKRLVSFSRYVNTNCYITDYIWNSKFKILFNL